MNKPNIISIQNRLSAARGDIKVDCLLRGARMVDVFTGTTVGQSVAIYDGIVVGFGDYKAKQIIELNGEFLLLGFIESHIHIESSCLAPQNFADAVIPHGTTTVIADPHEIANVLGIEGIDLMLEWGRATPIEFFFMLPSCVPSTSMETAGAKLEASDMLPFHDDPNILRIAEMMNYPGAIYGNQQVLEKLSMSGKGQRIDGHAPGLMGKKLSAYCIAGPRTDHECSTKGEALEKLARGMIVMIRKGSSAKNLQELIPLVNPSNERRYVFVSDDRSASDLVKSGHLDNSLRKAVKAGLDPLIAIRMVTINPAEAYDLRKKGAIAPGYKTDLVTVKDLVEFEVTKTWKSGEIIYNNNQTSDGNGIKTSLKVKSSTLPIPQVEINKFTLKPLSNKIKVINIVPDQIETKMSIEEVDISSGHVEIDSSRDILKLIVIERYTGKGNYSIGFVNGFGIENGAIASTVAHDSHNLIICGYNDLSMKVAANHLVKIGGGLVVVKDDTVVADLSLPVAGIMSYQNANDVAQSEKILNAAAKKLVLNCLSPS